MTSKSKVPLFYFTLKIPVLFIDDCYVFALILFYPLPATNTAKGFFLLLFFMNTFRNAFTSLSIASHESGRKLFSKKIAYDAG